MKSDRKKFIFLDRDGTINTNVPYVHKVEHLEFLPGVLEGLACLQKTGYRFIVITNQAGIARGYYMREHMEVFHEAMKDRAERAGVTLEAFYHCPHHPDFTGICLCRKPLPGMLHQAQKDHGIDLKKSIVIGNQEHDILAGKAVGATTFLITDQPDIKTEADYKVKTMLEVCDILLKKRRLLIIAQKVDEQDQLLGFFVGWIREFKQYYSKVTVAALRTPDKNWLRLLFRIFWEVPRHDAVFVHMAPIFAVIAGPWARLWGKRIGLWYTHKAVTWKLWLAEKLVNVIFTASPESFRLPSKKLVITGHGIDTGLFKPNFKFQISNNQLKILSVGRIAPIKNYEVLIGAAQILKNRGVDFSITIVGEPALEQDREYEQRIRRESSGLNVQFVGKKTQRELPDMYRSHDIFVHMSRTGSLDKVLLEAMACGMSVVSCNDAARGFLPSEWIFSEHDAHGLAAKIQHPGANNFDARQYVVEHHDVRHVIAAIAERI